jgi:hypothetical protein
MRRIAVLGFDKTELELWIDLRSASYSRSKVNLINGANQASIYTTLS